MPCAARRVKVRGPRAWRRRPRPARRGQAPGRRRPRGGDRL